MVPRNKFHPISQLTESASQIMTVAILLWIPSSAEIGPCLVAIDTARMTLKLAHQKQDMIIILDCLCETHETVNEMNVYCLTDTLNLFQCLWPPNRMAVK